MAASPLVHVEVAVSPREAQSGRVVIHARNFGDRYVFPMKSGGWLKHPLLEASIAFIGVPDDVAIEVAVSSDAPPGASIGTSASVTVALIAALDALRKGDMGPGEIAAAAHHVEMNVLGWQCGIQDQLCAAHGGINFIEMHRFPDARVTRMALPDRLVEELERRLVLI